MTKETKRDVCITAKHFNFNFIDLLSTVEYYMSNSTPYVWDYGHCSPCYLCVVTVRYLQIWLVQLKTSELSPQIDWTALLMMML